LQHPALQQIRQPTPASFNVVEAQAVLEQRWAVVQQQGLTPACQCVQQQPVKQPQEALDGPEHSGPESDFLQTLKAAADQNCADAAWDDG
jgi:hypothetical protein